MATYSVDKTGDFPSGTIVTYVCNGGYFLMDGDSQRVCNVPTGEPVGEFDGTEPRCVRK